MSEALKEIWLAGVDGCPGQWIVVYARPDGHAAPARVVKTFRDVVFAPERPCIIVVDVPIGLPKHSPCKGRLVEAAVRPLLGKLKSSVFRVPSRAAIYASDASEPSDSLERYLQACAIARATSDDRKAFAIQAFHICDKIIEVDSFLRANPQHSSAIYETHPEVAFWMLNSKQPLSASKKSGDGLTMRRELLINSGLTGDIVNGPAPKGAKTDDLVDALACAAIARRIHAGVATTYPDPVLRDDFGLPMAIWA